MPGFYANRPHCDAPYAIHRVGIPYILYYIHTHVVVAIQPNNSIIIKLHVECDASIYVAVQNNGTSCRPALMSLGCKSAFWRYCFTI